MNDIESHYCATLRHTTHYLAAGPEAGPLIIFIHGWPELSISWRHQLPFFAAMGFRAIAPDMRGYGDSSVYDKHSDYQLSLAVQDMVELLAHLNRASAVWVGHDWGSPVAWSIAAHHPDKCLAVANLCVPYAALEQGLDFVIDKVDRNIYPEAEYPAGQWEYMRFYQESFSSATGSMDANPFNFIQLIFRKGDPASVGQPSATAMTRKMGGWFGGEKSAPAVPRDEDVITEDDLARYAEALGRHGFFGPNSWYMNHEANAEYFTHAKNDHRLEMPALFIGADYDSTCETKTSRFTEPMRQWCQNLEEVTIASGHWMAQEKPREVNRALVRWMAQKVPDVWTE
ncbi:alpha/beta hydrolase [Pseudomonadales bacterium]|nr:alpha/beta hydrolase [Pseudomonadales bacterium]MDC1018327.1 alpha/beta hydrolase [Pseudomonadales bacterium]